MAATDVNETSQIVETIAQQIRAQGVKYKALLSIDDKTLRVHQKRGGFVFNSDIAYDRAFDVYSITVYKIDSRFSIKGEYNEAFNDIVAEKSYAGVYCDQLASIVGVV